MFRWPMEIFSASSKCLQYRNDFNPYLNRNYIPQVALTFLMFLGEFFCFLVYKFTYCLLRRRNVSVPLYIRYIYQLLVLVMEILIINFPQDGSENTNLLTSGDREFRPLAMLLPACLSAITTVLLLTGLYLTYASSFQAIRSKYKWVVYFIGKSGTKMSLQMTIFLL